MRVFLSAYTLRVDQSGSRKDNPKRLPQYCRLSSFDGHSDFRDVMESFLRHLTVKIKNETYKTYMKVISAKGKDRIICGVIESGIYGLSNNLRDVETGASQSCKTHLEK
ncbi:MAG: hypothetical protein KME14_24955 [Tildeniella torsiva UHER 1998/13D]|jgi:hypothetical protein|nr:hypothetical protein [Tildeniella torsiva UHER 1998/13D]